MRVRIYHNPRCSNSRGALTLLEEAGHQPEIIDYLSTRPDSETLGQLLAAMKMPARALLREKEAAYAALGLDNAALTEAVLIEAMVANPVLINRPIVVTDKGVRLCRPPEVVLEIL